MTSHKHAIYSKYNVHVEQTTLEYRHNPFNNKIVRSYRNKNRMKLYSTI